MYLSEFLKKLFRKSNAGLIAFFSVNIIILTVIVAIAMMVVGLDPVLSVAAGILGSVVLYLIFLAIVMSPAGEFIFRMNVNASEPDEEVMNYVGPIFESVYQKAKAADPTIPDGVKLYQDKKDNSINAFALGRKTICVCNGIMKLPPEEIEAVLAHEFGHLSHKDTTFSMGVVVGNFILTLLMDFVPIVLRVVGFGFKMMFKILSFIPVAGFIFSLLSSAMYWITHFTVEAYVFIFTRLCSLWMKLGFYLCQKSSRDCEFEADNFACQLGYGNGLLSLFRKFYEMNPEDPSDPILGMLAQSHPSHKDRIDNMMSVMNIAQAG